VETVINKFAGDKVEDLLNGLTLVTRKKLPTDYKYVIMYIVNKAYENFRNEDQFKEKKIILQVAYLIIELSLSCYLTETLFRDIYNIVVGIGSTLADNIIQIILDLPIQPTDNACRNICTLFIYKKNPDDSNIFMQSLVNGTFDCKTDGFAKIGQIWIPTQEPVVRCAQQ